MNYKNNSKGFIQIPLLIAIIISVVAASGAGYGVVEYHKTSKLVEEAEKLTEEEKFEEAIEKLESAQDKFLVKNLGIKKQEVANEIKENKDLIEDKLEYTQGIEEFNKENWEEAKDLLSMVSEDSPNYPEAKTKKTEAEKKITEKQISEAMKSAKQEIEKLKEESQQTTQQSTSKISQLEEKIAATEEDKSPQEMIITAADLEPYLPGIVQVVCDDGITWVSEGSGSLWNFSNEGWGFTVLTNQHVITTNSCLMDAQDAGMYRLSQNIFRYNNDTDVAIVKISSKIAESEPISDLSYKISSLQKCPNVMAIGSPVAILGYPAFAEQTAYIKGEEVILPSLTTTNGIISAHDKSVNKPFGNLLYPDYFVSAKIDSGNSGGIALAKDENGLCVLGIPTWLSIGEYETQGIVQNINNIFSK